MVAFLRLEKLRVRDAPAAGVVGRRGGRSARWSPRRRSTGATRGSTTRAGRSTRPARRRSRSAGTTTTARSTGRATAASCCASRRAPARVLEGARPRRCSTGAAGARIRASAASDAGRAAAGEPEQPWRAGRQQIEVTCATCARTASSPPGSRRRSTARPATRSAAASSTRRDGLGRGDSYTAEVYTPSPTERQLRDNAGTHYEDWLRSLRRDLPRPSRARRRRRPTGERSVPLRVDVARSGGERGRAGGRALRQLRRVRAGRVLARSDWRASGRSRSGCKRESPTAFEYVERVEALLGDGFAYSEQPPRGLRDARRLPVRRQDRLLPAVLRRRGAAAADGRRPGAGRDRLRARAPSTNASASSSCATSTPTRGSRRGSRATAGSTRDPTPAAAPPRSQPGDDGARRCRAAAPGAPDLGGERLSDLESGRALAAGRGPRLARRWRVVGALAAGRAGRRRAARAPPAPAAAAARAAADGRVRARAAPRPLRRRPGHDAVGDRARASPAGPAPAGYVRALREQRYSGRPAAPTAEQRRGLRAALARDAGVLRSWWALPPRREP